jgi:hypothetical protein
MIVTELHDTVTLPNERRNKSPGTSCSRHLVSADKVSIVRHVTGNKSCRRKESQIFVDVALSEGRKANLYKCATRAKGHVT